ncbi:MAG: hypothetical protein ACTHK3_00360 [Solirubrobacterales bacterium]
MNVSQICEDLKRLRGCSWNRPESFKKIKLLDHPAVELCAKEPKGRAQLVDALRDLLRQSLQRMEERGAVNGNPTASAAEAVLRLNGDRENQKLSEIRNEVAAGWTGHRRGAISGETFRLRYEEPEVLEPLAKELHQLLREITDKGRPTGKPRGSRSNNSRKSKRKASSSLKGNARKMFLYLKKMEEKRLRGLEQDKLKIRHKSEMIVILLKLSELANRTLQAVDRTPIAHWTADDDLQRYLEHQLKQIRKGVSLERIYLVEDSLWEDADEQDLLLDFVQRHDSAYATLLLCPVEKAAEIESVFSVESWGLILADSKEDPMAVTGKLMKGRVGNAFLYTREQATDIENFQEQYNALRTLIMAEGYDRELRKELGLL